MRHFSVILIILSILITTTPIVDGATYETQSSVEPSIPVDGDIWDGETINKPTKLVEKDGIYYYQIDTCGELAYVAEQGGEWLTYNYILQSNLILNDTQIIWDDNGNCINTNKLHEWNPIKSFAGVFEGNNFTISGVYIDQPNESNIGLFGLAGPSGSSASIKNLKVVNSFVAGYSYVGGIVGYYNTSWNDSKSIFSNCIFSGFVRAYNNYAGGLTGYAGGGPGFSNLINYGDIYADKEAGGIAGTAYYLEYCYNYGNVSYLTGIKTSGTKFGGIGGYGGDYKNCINFGSVYGISEIGGIYGEEGGGTYDLRYCENRGIVKGDTYVGGIAGISSDERIRECKNSGIVKGKEYVGGIVGKRSAGFYYNTYVIEDVYNVGKVSGENYIGGIVGYAGEHTNMARAYNIGSVSATGIAGSILCSDSLIWGKCTVNNCFYEKSKTPLLFGCGFSGVTDDVGSILAKTASELKNSETYPQYDYHDNPDGWNIAGEKAIWLFGEYNNGYPYLSWESETESDELMGISLMSEEISIGVGDTYCLNVQQVPTFSILPAVTWKSSDKSIATVDSNGVVTGKGIGTAQITASVGNFSDTCTVFVKERSSDEYQIGTLIIHDSDGNVLSEIPTGKFLVTVPVTKLTNQGNAILLLASYDKNGRYEGLLYAKVENAPVGSTISITLPVDNTQGNISKLKAFAIASFSDMQPISKSVFLA